MANKAKLQILRQLDDRIAIICNNCIEYEPEFDQAPCAFIFGNHCGNTTNYIGLTTDYKLHNATNIVNGLVFFKSEPTNEIIDKEVKLVREYSFSKSALDYSSKNDLNENLYLIYYFDAESKTIEKKIYDSNSQAFVEEQPKLSVLDESKMYSHHALVKFNLSLKLNVCQDINKLGNQDLIKNTLKEVIGEFMGESDKIKLHLAKSNYSSNFCKPKKDQPTESLYEFLDIPNEVMQKSDYLPQMTKDDKKKLADKWKSKVKNQRAPLEVKLEHNSLSYDDNDSNQLGNQYYGFKLESYYYLNMNDSIYKSLKFIQFMIRQNLNLLEKVLLSKADQTIEPDEFKCCTFKPKQLGHLVQAIYAIPTNSSPDFNKLKESRDQIHKTYLIPKSEPKFRFSQRVLDLDNLNQDEKSGYLCNVHEKVIEQSGIKNGKKNIIEGTYTYHHYLQDRCQDNGWGCAYRSLQTIISWFKHQAYIYSPDCEIRAISNKKEDKINDLRHKLHKESRVPTHEEIQSVLVDVGDKQASFIGSQKWIGSQEVNYVLQHLYNLDCKFISVSSGSELTYKARDLGLHFAQQSTPIMIGGGVLAHTIIGIDFNDKNGDISYLILDPHYTGGEDLSIIQKKGWCGWKKNSFWDKSAFYNLCLPQKPYEY